MTATELSPAPPAPLIGARHRVFWPVLLTIVLADIVTKRWAERALELHFPEEVVGHWLRWTLTYNTGAALNLSVGDASRVVFSAVAILMLGYLFHLYRQSAPHERATPAALALIAAGALGNLIDRLRHGKGVVDFIDVGTASWRFWTFNIADMGVTVGAVLLAILMWREDREAAAPERSRDLTGRPH
ncbi:MAG: signal peptidase II [Gemmatimonadaceae bacterium]